MNFDLTKTHDFFEIGGRGGVDFTIVKSWYARATAPKSLIKLFVLKSIKYSGDSLRNK